MRATIEAMLKEEEFADQFLFIRNAKAGDSWALRCSVCKSDVMADRKHMRQHCFGTQKANAREVLLEDVSRQASLKHYKAVQARARAEREAKIGTAAVKRNREVHFFAVGKEFKPNTDDEVIAERVTMLQTLYEVGVPLTVMDNEMFRARFEGTVNSAGRQGLIEVRPLLHQQGMDTITKALARKRVALISDGAKNNSLVIAVLARYVASTGQICEPCIALTTVERNLNAPGLKGVLQRARERVQVPLAEVRSLF